jgi:NTP pyrophosphatase (non-canonical NTP hydrolase)|tara:strand:+ start:46 stop:231 length:186 start_codon:yes stop_codon:yes gene_type:complete
MKLNVDQKRIFLKCAEELNELAIELLQSVNKENKNNWGKIYDEIEDVEKYIKLLKSIKTKK